MAEAGSSGSGGGSSSIFEGGATELVNELKLTVKHGKAAHEVTVAPASTIAQLKEKLEAIMRVFGRTSVEPERVGQTIEALPGIMCADSINPRSFFSWIFTAWIAGYHDAQTWLLVTFDEATADDVRDAGAADLRRLNTTNNI